MERLGPAAGPRDLNDIGSGGAAKTEMEPLVVM
jgi:hypothetical protein